jgi:hypothetical protein
VSCLEFDKIQVGPENSFSRKKLANLAASCSTHSDAENKNCEKSGDSIIACLSTAITASLAAVCKKQTAAEIELIAAD